MQQCSARLSCLALGAGALSFSIGGRTFGKTSTLPENLTDSAIAVLNTAERIETYWVTGPYKARRQALVGISTEPHIPDLPVWATGRVLAAADTKTFVTAVLSVHSYDRETQKAKCGDDTTIRLHFRSPKGDLDALYLVPCRKLFLPTSAVRLGSLSWGYMDPAAAALHTMLAAAMQSIPPVVASLSLTTSTLRPLTIEFFKQTLRPTLASEQVLAIYGEPERDLGSGIHIYEYRLVDGSFVTVGCTDHVHYAHWLQGKSSEDLLKATSSNRK